MNRPLHGRKVTLPAINMEPDRFWKTSFLLSDPLSGSMLIGGRV